MEGNALEINGRLIGVEDELQLTINSPFLDRETETLSDGSSLNPQGSNSFGFTKSGEADMEQLVGNMDKINAKGEDVVIKGVKLFSDGSLVDTGNILVESVKGSFNRRGLQYSFNFLSGDRDDFFELIKNKSIRELDLGGDITIAGNTPPNWGEIQSGTIGQDLVLSAARGSGGVPTPIPYEDIFGNGGRSEIAATAIWAENVVSYGHDYVCFPTLKVVASGDEVRTVNKFNSDTNQFDTYEEQTIPTVKGGTVFTFTTYIQKDNPLVPMYYYHQVLRCIFSENGYELQDDWLLEDPQFLKMIMVNSHSILKPRLISITGCYGIDGLDYGVLYTELDTVIKPENHLPDMTMAEFLRDCMLKFCIYFDVRGKKVYIRHNKLQETQRLVNVVGSNFEIRGQRDTGLTLRYDFNGNDSFKAENRFTDPLTDLPDESELANLSNGDLYIDRNYNAIYRKAAGTNELVCSNLVAYNSGKSKVYEMPLTPVNCETTGYNKALDPDFDALDLDAHLPWIAGSVTGYDTELYNYIFDHEDIDTVGTPTISWSADDYYTLDSKDSAYIEPDSTSIVAFYHGLKQTLDLIAEDIYYPYASNHNYIPGQASPKEGDWHLGIIGTEGLIETFWGIFVNIFTANRRIDLYIKEPLQTIREHDWTRSFICRGARLYLSSVRAVLPLRNMAVYECYEV